MTHNFSTMNHPSNAADRLLTSIKAKKAPMTVGLDPVISRMPCVYFKNKPDTFAGVSAAITQWSKDIIDALHTLIPAVKPQIAFYEMFGHHGVKAFENTVNYAKEKDLSVIEDGKRNDIGNTALAYAQGHLGKVPLVNKSVTSPFDVDFLTVSPFLGPESLMPFINTAAKEGKGLFILVKTSNPSNGIIQQATTLEGNTISDEMALFVNHHALLAQGTLGYSSIGAVVGATYPKEAKTLRSLMPKSLFLVPGYGAQGGGAQDVMACFNQDGLGAIVSASRSVIFAHEKSHGQGCSRDDYQRAVYQTAKNMQKEIYEGLKKHCNDLAY